MKRAYQYERQGSRQMKERIKAAGLTATELRVYRYIEGYIKEQGCGPSYKEVGWFLAGQCPDDYKKFRGQYYVKLLEGKGYIEMGRDKRHGHRATRSMKLTGKTPESEIHKTEHTDDGSEQGNAGESAENQQGIDETGSVS